MKECPNCHNEVKDDANFCPHCGYPLDNQASQSNDQYQQSNQNQTNSQYHENDQYQPYQPNDQYQNNNQYQQGQQNDQYQQNNQYQQNQSNGQYQQSNQYQQNQQSQPNNRRINIFTWINGLLLLACFVVPLALVYFMTDSSVSSSGSSSKIVLDEVKESSSVSVAYQYDSLEEFDENVEDVAGYITDVQLYEDSLINMIGLDIDASSYDITLYNNYDLQFDLIYSFEVDENYDLQVRRQYTRSGNLDKTSYSLTQTGIESLEDLEIGSYFDQIVDTSYFDNIIDGLLSRSDEFEEKKDNIGHFGFGEYGDDVSIVIYNDGEGMYKAVYNYYLSE